MGYWGEYLELRVTGWQGNGEDYITRSFTLCTPHQILFGWANRDEREGLGMWHVWAIWGVYIGFRWGSLGERDHLEDPGLDGRIILKWILKTLYIRHPIFMPYHKRKFTQRPPYTINVNCCLWRTFNKYTLDLEEVEWRGIGGLIWLRIDTGCWQLWMR